MEIQHRDRGTRELRHERKRDGWVVDITPFVIGLPEESELVGRRVFIQNSTLRIYGINPREPETANRMINSKFMTGGELLWDYLEASNWMGCRIVGRRRKAS
jgi:hypothetical protein